MPESAESFDVPAADLGVFDTVSAVSAARARAVACPAPRDTAAPEPPTPASLAYSFTLPAGPASPAIAREAARTVLKTHGLGGMLDAAVQVVGELTACAWRFTPAEQVYVSLRYRDGSLRVIVYDGHPRHTHPRLAAACETQRRAALRLLACVVRACRGEWGFGDAREPGGGTRAWAVLPHATAAAFTRPERTRLPEGTRPPEGTTQARATSS